MKTDLQAERARLLEQVGQIGADLGRLRASETTLQAGTLLDQAQALLEQAQHEDTAAREADAALAQAEREARAKALRGFLNAAQADYAAKLRDGLRSLSFAGETLDTDELRFLDDPTSQMPDASRAIRPTTWQRLPDKITIHLSGLRQRMRDLRAELESATT